MTWAMGMVMRLAGNKEGKGEGRKGNCDSNEGGGQQRGQGRQGNGNGNKDDTQRCWKLQATTPPIHMYWPSGSF